MDTKLKQRLVGAAVIAALIFITLAILLKNNNPAQQQESLAAKSSAIAAVTTTNNTTNSQSSNNQQNLADNNPSQITQTNNIPSPDNIPAANATNNQPNTVTAANNPIANQNVNNAVSNNQAVINPAINTALPSTPNNSTTQNVNNAAQNNQAIANTPANPAKTIADNNVIVDSENAASNGTQTIPTPTTNTNNTDQAPQNTSQNQIALNQNTDDQTAVVQTPPTNSGAADQSTIPSNPPAQQKTHKKVSHTKTAIKKSTTVVVSSSANTKHTKTGALDSNSHGTKIWAVQVGSFKDVSNANTLSKKLIAHHYTTYTVTFNTSKGLRTHVYAGAKSLDKASAKMLVAQLQKTLNINAILVSTTSKTTQIKKVSLARKKSSSVVEVTNTNV